MSTQDAMAIKAQEALLRAEREIERIKLHMRNAKPSKMELAFIRAACADAEAALTEVHYWATKTYREEN